MNTQYIPDRLDRLAEAALGQAVRDIEQGKGNSSRTAPSQNDAEAALAWLTEPAAHAWLDDLEYPLSRINEYLVDASRAVLARRIDNLFTRITQPRSRRKTRHALENQPQRTDRCHAKSRP